MVSTNIYHNQSSYSNCKITVDLELDKSELTLKAKGTSKTWVMFYCYTIKGVMEYSHVFQIEADGKYQCVLDENTAVDNGNCILCSYMYNIKDQKIALGYQGALLKSVKQSVVPKLSYKNGIYGALYTIGYTNTFNIYNSNDYDVTYWPTSNSKDVLILKAGSTALDEQYTSLDDFNFRKVYDPRSVPRTLSGLRYQDLTYEEKETYIPSFILKDRNKTLRWTDIHDWELSKNHLLTTTLTYCPTKDKELHFKDSDGKSYKYNADCMRDLIKHMCNGKITGKFILKPRGNRQLKYLPYPYDPTVDSGDEKGDLALCDSDPESDIDYEPDNSINITENEQI